jgi:hypothetical protein
MPREGKRRVIRKSLRGLTFVGALALTLAALPAPAAAFHGGPHFAVPCAGPGSNDCVVGFAVGSTNGVGGTSFPAGLIVDAWYQAGALQVQLKKTSGDAYDLSAAIPTTTEVTVTVRLAPGFTPSVFIGAAHIVDWRWDPATRELTVIAFPRASSWAAPLCIPGNCPPTASTDYGAMAIFAADDTVIENAPPEAAAFMTTFLTKYTGGFISTNAQYFAPPMYDGTSLYFDLGAPHFKTNGTTPNSGFFRVLVPDPVISDLWLLSPSSFTASSVTVTVDGTPTTTTLTRVNARGAFPAGWLFESSSIGFSTPHVAITPVKAASVPEERETPLERAPSVNDSGAGPSTSNAAVGLPPSGIVRSGLTLTGVGASFALPQETALTTPDGQPFAGLLQPPLSVPDPTGGKLVSVTHLRASGVAVGGTEIRLSRPATLTLPVPQGANPADFQAVQAIGSDLKYLPGTYGKDGISVQVDRIAGTIAPYGLVRVR